MRKGIKYMAVALFFILSYGCQKVDLTPIEGKIRNLETKIEKITEKLNQLEERVNVLEAKGEKKTKKKRFKKSEEKPSLPLKKKGR